MEMLSIVFMVLWGLICNRMAENRNRDPFIGFALGALFGLFAVIGYAIAGNKK